jgi:hypothetical protein
VERAGQTPPNEDHDLNDEAAPGAGAIVSREPDGSPQGMTAMTSSLEPRWGPLG